MSRYADMDVSAIVLDLETGIRNHAAIAQYLDPVQPARNLRDPEKIAADIEQRSRERESKYGLDYNIGDIVAVGYWTKATGTVVYPCRNDMEESAALTLLWGLCRQRTIVGFNCKNFDLRYMVQRSRLLGIAHPTLDLGRYGKSSIVDLYGELTFNDGFSDGCMRRSLKSFARRFGIAVPDHIDGANIQALVDEDDYDSITSHCVADVELTRQLAVRLGYLPAPALAEAVL